MAAKKRKTVTTVPTLDELEAKLEHNEYFSQHHEEADEPEDIRIRTYLNSFFQYLVENELLHVPKNKDPDEFRVEWNEEFSRMRDYMKEQKKKKQEDEEKKAKKEKRAKKTRELRVEVTCFIKDRDSQHKTYVYNVPKMADIDYWSKIAVNIEVDVEMVLHAKSDGVIFEVCDEEKDGVEQWRLVNGPDSLMYALMRRADKHHPTIRFRCMLREHFAIIKEVLSR